ncbi:MAG: class I SAM-dependent methyltransferase [Acidobacteria bacterium]|nr:class I SAM-dependent methyltransferase [Acidobacteriota bacterium]
MSVEHQVRVHFAADADRFDAIYEDQKSAFARWIDNVWRGVVRRRFDLTLERLAPLKGKTVLDVGCGSGRYCLAYAQQGAAKVVGVDFAAPMIELAKKHAARLGVERQCEFRVGTFPQAVPDGPFDASTAMGFFDYVEEPIPIIRRMRELTQETMVLSFPKAVEWRIPIRWLRFKLVNKCPLFLYTESKVRKMLATAGVTRYELIKMDRDYIVIAHV